MGLEAIGEIGMSTRGLIRRALFHVVGRLFGSPPLGGQSRGKGESSPIGAHAKG